MPARRTPDNRTAANLTPEILVEATGVSRDFGAIRALESVDLTVRSGELVGMLGPNGAGKTTLLSLITGLRAPSSGTVRLFGGDPRSPANRIRLGNTPQQTGLPDHLRVGEVIEFVARHFPNPMPVTELLDRFGLTELAGRQSAGLSGGQQRRLVVALAFVGNPALVILDEPTTGLDVDARHALWDAVRDYHRDGGAVILTSHYLEEVEALAHRVVVIDGGRVLADDTMTRIRDRVSVRKVSVSAAALPELPTAAQITRVDDRFDILTSDADQLVRELVLSGTAFSDLEVTGASLEQAFVTMTQNPGTQNPGTQNPGTHNPATHGQPTGAV